MDISEKNFEETIEQALLASRESLAAASPKLVLHQPPLYGVMTSNFLPGSVQPGGYHRRTSEDYDRALCLLPGDVLDFIYATQPKEWEKFRKQQGDKAKALLFQRLGGELRTRGTLDVLRKGIKMYGCAFKLAYFPPASGLNYETLRLYAGNIFSEVRQLHFSERSNESIDLALFLNGLPIFSAELKNPFNGQNVKDAVKQYRDRDQREPLFAFGRVLAHFAVDPDLVYMTTHIKGTGTVFLPFNQGYNRGAGNAPSWQGFATAYLWERIWAQESVLNLIDRFIQQVEVLDEQDKKTGKQVLIFPRYHQLDSVRRLIADARQHGPGKRYLIEHSAGSGKSNSIAWLAHQLSVLFNEHDRRVFDSIIVVTDRRVLDKQLQATVQQFEQTRGVVENIDTTSRKLREALEGGKTIIVTTLQKFPQIVKQIEELQVEGKTFAVIIDEAHSSQSGESSGSLKQVLTAGNLDAYDIEESEEGDDLEDRIAEVMRARGFPRNVSFFAFTATPKPKTLELFGTRDAEGRYEAFSLYSMKQAIEERFILDVLENYTTYQTYWNLLKKIDADPQYDRTKAALLLKSFVDMHRRTIDKRVTIIVEHFADKVAHLIDGRARAMIVTRSRVQAVRYKLEVDAYLKAHGYPFRALVAFSGTVKDSGQEYSEAGMNGFSESKTAEIFKQEPYRILIVANKYQTGFDQPLLHTMYVDKKLGGVNAVQTLSRLNRTYPGKEGTMVLDFVNEAEDIQAAFQPYYEKTLLSQATDPNLLYDLQGMLEHYHLYSADELNRFASLSFDPKGTQDKLYAALAPVVDRYKEATQQDQAEFRGHLKDYVRLYAFLSQLLTFTDTELEKLYAFGRLLLRRLPNTYENLPVEIQQNIDIESYRVVKTGSGTIKLERGANEVDPIGPKEIYSLGEAEMEPLSQIIRELNEHFGTEFNDDDKLCIRELEQRLVGNAALEASVRANTLENARLTFNQVVNDLMQDMVDSHFKFYKQVTDNSEFSKMFFDWLFDRYRAASPGSNQYTGA